jgi:hypothetical protein
MTAESFRARAAECLAQARQSHEETDKAIFLEMAEEWLSLAAGGEKPKAVPIFALVG